MKFFYNLGLILFLLMNFPKLFQKKYRKSVLYRLGLKFPHLEIQEGQEVIWMHAVSVGETKAIATLIPHIKKSDPFAFLLISSGTEMGHEEAKRSISSANAHIFLPFDFPFLIKKYLRRIRPKKLLLCEGELWLNLVEYSYLMGCKIYLINGKLSEKSFSRYRFLKRYSKRLFMPFEKFCMQDEVYSERLRSLGVPAEKLYSLGNIKLDIPAEIVPSDQILKLKQELSISKDDKVITIVSTHDREEEMLLAALRKIPQVKILLAPRHPERFSVVEQLLKTLMLTYNCYSSRKKPSQEASVILIDSMGVLPICYELSTIVIVGGSFIPGIGGHNVHEPTLYGKYVLFGPYMQGQKELARCVIEKKMGEKVELLDLVDKVEGHLHGASENGKVRTENRLQGAAFRTWEEINVDGK